jgi:hypothetical protein
VIARYGDLRQHGIGILACWAMSSAGSKPFSAHLPGLFHRRESDAIGARIVAARDHIVNLFVVRHHDEQGLSWAWF